MSDSVDTVTTRLIARVKHGAEEEWTLGGSIASSAGTLNTEKTLASYVKVTDGVRKVQMKSSFTESGFRPQVFSFNRCFSQGTSQADFFGGCGAVNSLDRLLRSSNLGSADSDQVDFCILAYGQTGAGKTHTMFGAGPLTGPPINHSHIDAAVEENYETEIQEKDPHSQPEDGLIVRSIEYLFLQLLHTSSVVHNFHLKLSCLEICDDVVLDLFSGSSLPVRIKENVSEGFSVSGCQFIDCTSFESAAAAIELVARHRRGRYAPNSVLSPLKDSDIHHGVHKVDRSHCIVEVCVCVPMLVGEGAFSEFNSGMATPANELADNGVNGAYLRNGPASPRYITRAKVTFVDLAGSERLRSEPKVDAKSTANKSSSEASAKEPRAINPSLYVLGKVIAGLVRAKGDIYADDVPFHDSVLTKLLIQPLSRGNVLRSNLFIACIDDSPRCEYETLRTLKFATSCVQLRSKAASLNAPKMSKQDKLINELKLSIKKVKEDNQEMRRTILATPSWGDKILAHCDEDTLETSAAFANAPPKMKPKIKDVKKPVSLSEKKRTWASWKLFENNSKAKTAVINAHQTHLPISNLLTSGSRVYPMAGPTLNGQFPAHYMSQTSQSTVRGGSPLRSTTAPQGSTAEDEDFEHGFYDDEEREEMLLKKLADGMNTSAQNKARPSSSPNEKTSFPAASLFGSVTMSNVSGVSGGDSHLDRGTHFSKTGPLPRGKSARPSQPAPGVDTHGHSQEQSAKYENHMAEKRMAAQMKKRVLDECRKKNHQPISPYLGHFVPKRVIHDRPSFEVPMLHDIVPLHASIHQDEPEPEEGAQKLKGASTSGELRDGSHSRGHTPNKTHSGSKSRSPSRSPSRSRPGSTNKKRGAHATPGSGERPGSRGHRSAGGRAASGKVRSPEVLALEKAIQPHSMMFDLLDAEYSDYRRDDDEIASNPSSLVDRILPTTAEKAAHEDRSFSPRVEPLNLSVAGTGLSPQQKMALKEEKPAEAAAEEEDAEYDSYDEQFEAEEEPVVAPAAVTLQVETTPEEAQKAAEGAVDSEETITMSDEGAMEPPPVVTWSPSTKNKNDETPRSVSPTASIESATSKSPSHSSYPLPTDVILAQAQLGIHVVAEPSTPGFLSPSGRSQKAAYTPQPASPVITSPKEVRHTWENEAVLLMAPVFAASEERQMEERQESFIQRMTMSSKGGFSDSASSRDAFIPRVSSHDEEEENYEDEGYEFDADEEEEVQPTETVVVGIAMDDEPPTSVAEPSPAQEAESTDVERDEEPASAIESASVDASAEVTPVVEQIPTQDSYEDYDEEFEDDEAASKKESDVAPVSVEVPEADANHAEYSAVEADAVAVPAAEPTADRDAAMVESAPVANTGPDLESTDVVAQNIAHAEEVADAQQDTSASSALEDAVVSDVLEEREEVFRPTIEPPAVAAADEQEEEYEMEFNEDEEEVPPAAVHVAGVAEAEPATEPAPSLAAETGAGENAETSTKAPASEGEVATVAPAVEDVMPAAAADSEDEEPVAYVDASPQEAPVSVPEAASEVHEAAIDTEEEEKYEDEFEAEREAEAIADAEASAEATTDAEGAAAEPVAAEDTPDNEPVPVVEPLDSTEAATDDVAAEAAEVVSEEAESPQAEPGETSETAEKPVERTKPALVPPPANLEALASDVASGAVSRAVARIASRDEAQSSLPAQDVLTVEALAGSAVSEVLSRFTPREPEPEPGAEAGATPGRDVIDVLDLPLSPVHMLGDIDPVHHISATTMSEPFHLLDDFSEYDISWEMSPSPDAKGHGIAESEAESAKVVSSQRPVAKTTEPAVADEPAAAVVVVGDEVVTEEAQPVENEEPVSVVSVDPTTKVPSEEAPAPTELVPVFAAGTRVMCNYHASGDWYAGTVASTNTDGTHNIDYDDGDKEASVPAGMIRLETAEAAADTASLEATFAGGAKIDANYRGKGRWYPGVVSRVRETGTYDVDYDDGEKETHVEAELIRQVIPFTREDTATALFMDDLVLQRNDQAGFVEAEVDEARVGALVQEPSATETEAETEVVREVAPSMQAGARVEGNYRASGVWYPGVLARVHADGSGDINYDDGEVEAYVPMGLIRSEKDKETPVVVEVIAANVVPEAVDAAAVNTPLFAVRDKVEARYHGKKRWYAGVISQVHHANAFDIDYDDGEKETNVAAENIRTAIVAVEEDPALTELMDELVGELTVPSPVKVSELQAGARVEGNYRASGVWYPGVLARVHADGSGDINYDDGEVEAYVPADLIRAEKGLESEAVAEVVAESAAIEPPHTDVAPSFAVGDKVEANYRGKGRWYPGVVSRVRDAGTYDIDYDDGEKETHVEAGFIRLAAADTEAPAAPVGAPKLATSSPLQAGARVEGNYRASGVWYPGVLARVHADGSGDINYDDGEVEAYVPAGLIRAEVKAAAPTDAEIAVVEADAPVTSAFFFLVGSRVEGNYRGKGRWYPGTVSRVRDAGTYDVDYDGGEKETHVVEAELIPLGASVAASTKVVTAAAVASPSALQAGTRVEGNYRASGVWYPGVLARVHADGSGDINYDDGEVEAYVPAGLIRAEEQTVAPAEPDDTVPVMELEPSADLADVVEGVKELTLPVNEATQPDTQVEPSVEVAESASAVPTGHITAQEENEAVDAVPAETTEDADSEPIVDAVVVVDAPEPAAAEPDESAAVEGAPEVVDDSVEVDTAPVMTEENQEVEPEVAARALTQDEPANVTTEVAPTVDRQAVVDPEPPLEETSSTEDVAQADAPVQQLEDAVVEGVSAADDGGGMTATEKNALIEPGATTEVTSSKSVQIVEPSVEEPTEVAVAIDQAVAGEDSPTDKLQEPASEVTIDQPASPVAEETESEPAVIPQAVVVVEENDASADAPAPLNADEPSTLAPAAVVEAATELADTTDEPVIETAVEACVVAAAGEAEAASVVEEVAHIDGEAVAEELAATLPDPAVEEVAPVGPDGAADETVEETAAAPASVEVVPTGQQVESVMLEEPVVEDPVATIQAEVGETNATGAETVSEDNAVREEAGLVAAESTEGGEVDAAGAETTVSAEEPPATSAEGAAIEEPFPADPVATVVAGSAETIASVEELPSVSEDEVVSEVPPPVTVPAESNETGVYDVETSVGAEEPSTTSEDNVVSDETPPVASQVTDAAEADAAVPEETAGAGEPSIVTEELPTVDPAASVYAESDAAPVEAIVDVEEEPSTVSVGETAVAPAETVAEETVPAAVESAAEEDQAATATTPDLGELTAEDDKESGGATEPAEEVTEESVAIPEAEVPVAEPLEAAADSSVGAEETNGVVYETPVVASSPEEDAVNIDNTAEDATEEAVVDAAEESSPAVEYAAASVRVEEPEPANGEISVKSEESHTDEPVEIVTAIDGSTGGVVVGEGPVVGETTEPELTATPVQDEPTEVAPAPAVAEIEAEQSGAESAEIVVTEPVAEQSVEDEVAMPVAEPVLSEPEPEPAAPRVIEKGSRIEGNYRGKGAWIPGQVARMHNNGSADVNYDNGEVEAFVPPAWMRPAEEEKVAESPTEPEVSQAVPEEASEPAAVEEAPISEDVEEPAAAPAGDLAGTDAAPAEPAVVTEDEVRASAEDSATTDAVPVEGAPEPAAESDAQVEQPVAVDAEVMPVHTDAEEVSDDSAQLAVDDQEVIVAANPTQSATPEDIAPVADSDVPSAVMSADTAGEPSSLVESGNELSADVAPTVTNDVVEAAESVEVEPADAEQALLEEPAAVVPAPVEKETPAEQTELAEEEAPAPVVEPATEEAAPALLSNDEQVSEDEPVPVVSVVDAAPVESTEQPPVISEVAESAAVDVSVPEDAPAVGEENHAAEVSAPVASEQEEPPTTEESAESTETGLDEATTSAEEDLVVAAVADAPRESEVAEQVGIQDALAVDEASSESELVVEEKVVPEAVPGEVFEVSAEEAPQQSEELAGEAHDAAVLDDAAVGTENAESEPIATLEESAPVAAEEDAAEPHESDPVESSEGTPAAEVENGNDPEPGPTVSVVDMEEAVVPATEPAPAVSDADAGDDKVLIAPIAGTVAQEETEEILKPDESSTDNAELTAPEVPVDNNPAEQPVEEPEASPVSVEDSPDPISDASNTNTAVDAASKSKKLVPALSENLFDVDFSELGSVKQPARATDLNKNSTDSEPALSSAELAALALSIGSGDENDAQVSESVAPNAEHNSGAVDQKQDISQVDSGVSKSRKSTKSGKSAGEDEDLFDVDFE